MEFPTKIKVFCNWCKNQTNHSIKADYSLTECFESNPDGSGGGPFAQHSHQVIECDGCENVSFRYEWEPLVASLNSKIASGDWQSAPVEQPTVTYYPERLKDWLSEKPIAGLPLIIRKAYKEVLDCYNYNLLLMCAVGLRSIVEGLCTQFGIVDKDQSGNTVSLGNRIRQLANKRLISSNLADALMTHKELGNDAIHNLVAPEKAELMLAIELVENAFDNLYNISRRHHELGDRMTRRILG